MALDIQNVERGACVDGCRSCPNFLSVEPGRILCDYCGCPPTKHEKVIDYQCQDKNSPTSVQSTNEKENNLLGQHDKIQHLKGEGVCYSASRTSSNDSGYYISCSSYESASSNTSATASTGSISSGSPYISEEEVEGVEEDQDCFNTTPNQSLVASSYKCTSTQMLVKIRTRPEEKSIQSDNNLVSHNPLIKFKAIDSNNATRTDCDQVQSSQEQRSIENCLHMPVGASVMRQCKKKSQDMKPEVVGDDAKNKETEASDMRCNETEDTTVVEKCTLHGIGQLDIGENEAPLRSKDAKEYKDLPDENKFIRGENDCDVSDHHRTRAGTGDSGGKRFGCVVIKAA